MRLATFGVFLFGLPVLAFAQADPCAPHRFTFDPYKPSDLAIVRQYGGSVLAHAPLTALLQLDPYVPTEAKLLREYGGGLPVWPYLWYPAYPQLAYPPRPAYPPDCGPVRESTAAPTTSTDPPITTVAELLTALDQARASSGTASPSGGRPASAPAVSVDLRTGVSIDYAGRTWVSAGRAVAFDEARFVRVGESAGSPVFRQRGAKDEIIYVPTTPGVVAPFRATSK